MNEKLPSAKRQNPTPHELGVLAHKNLTWENQEVPCEFVPGSEEYKQFANGFCHEIDKQNK